MDLLVRGVESDDRHIRQYPPPWPRDTRRMRCVRSGYQYRRTVGRFSLYLDKDLMIALFSSRLGCFGSLLVSVLLTAMVILVLYR